MWFIIVYILYLIIGAMGKTGKWDDFIYYLIVFLLTLLVGYALFSWFAVPVNVLLGYGFLAFIMTILGYIFS